MSPVFFFLFAAIGALMPYLSVYYHGLGLTGTQISILMSVLPVLLFISQPIFGPLTDRSGHRGRMLSWLLLIVGGTGLLLGVGSTFAVLLPLVLLWSFFAGPLVPIADSIALGEVQATGVSYPRLRLWGSVGFLVATTLLGRLYNVVDLRVAFIGYAALNAAAWYFARRLPAEGLTSQKPVWPELWKLLKNPFLITFLLLCGVMQTTQAAHQLFFSVHLESVGGTKGLIGLAWGLGALTEVPVWWVLGNVTRRVGPLPLLGLAGGVYALRWYLYSMVASPEVLVGLQLLQGFSFAIFMPTAVVLVGELIPAELRTTGQALLVLINGGLATVLGNLVAGRMVDASGTAGLYQTITYVALASGVGFVLMALVLKLRAGAKAKAAST